MGKKIKILWLVNIVFPEICKSLGIKETHIGGWLSAYRNILKSQDIPTLRKANMIPFLSDILQHQ